MKILQLTILFFTSISFLHHVQAQNDEDIAYVYLQGTIKNQKEKKAIAFANIYLKDQPIGTTSNAEGNWSLTLEETYKTETIVLSAIGYRSISMTVEDYLKMNGKTVYLSDTVYQLSDIFITSIPAKEIIGRAIRNIEKNYPIKPYQLQGFYRTSFNENGKYVRLLESALKIYDEGFLTENTFSVDYIQLRKSYDYRSYHWKEGGNYLASFLYGDFVRNKNGQIRDLYDRWNYEIEGISYYDGDEIFRVSASLPIDNDYEQYKAVFYVRIKDYAIIQLDYDFWWDSNHFPGIKSESIEFRRNKVVIKTQYRPYHGRLYLSYQSREAHWVIYDYDKPPSQRFSCYMQIHDELLIHKVKANYRRQPDHKLANKGDIYSKVDEYNKRFWKRYNKPVDTELFQNIKADLEKDASLEKQFKYSNIEDVIK